ncbi:MAG TPA: MEDS domain-containing protein [Gemmatimonadaceae bacterium]|nr:MEDS domain-containing protein [Gemmatimonadaceae bacterium]
MCPTFEEPEVFWGELAPCQHLVEFYDHDQVFLDSLEGFASGGIRAGEAVIVIATEPHRRALEDRLAARGIDVELARSRQQYIDLDAEATLATFMSNGWPDDDLFMQAITRLLIRAGAPARPVRAFGEMVALLWARGDNAATIRLEHLWHTLCLARGFSLFCAYPKSGFTEDASASMREICATHSKVFIG